MRAHYLQHVPFEGLGSMESWLQNAGYEISCTRFFESGVLPPVDSFDLLVIMGGPMSVNDEQAYPWLVNEKLFIQSVVEAGIPTLGVCLGAQLIASALGGDVFPNTVKEIGWWPIEAVDEASSSEPSTFRFPRDIDVFHWHGETFSLPDGAIRTAQSRGCQNQAFQFGGHVIGLQFHLETTPASARAIVESCRDELVAGEFIQTEVEMLSVPPDRYESINRTMGEVLGYLQRAGR
jgi:GMP synthase-like glutamine amidotransferase